MKHRCTIVMVFEVDTKEWGGREWRPHFTRQARDVIRATNAMPKLTGKLVQADLRFDDVARPTHLNREDMGAPLMRAPQVFTYCKDCPNTSYCATQGYCARVKALEKGPSRDAIKSMTRTVYGIEGIQKAREFALVMRIEPATVEDWLKSFKIQGRSMLKKKGV